MATLDCHCSCSLHHCHALDQPPSLPFWSDHAAQSKRGVLSNPGRYGRLVVLFGEWTGRLELEWWRGIKGKSLTAAPASSSPPCLLRRALVYNSDRAGGS